MASKPVTILLLKLFITGHEKGRNKEIKLKCLPVIFRGMFTPRCGSLSLDLK